MKELAAILALAVTVALFGGLVLPRLAAPADGAPPPVTVLVDHGAFHRSGEAER